MQPGHRMCQAKQLEQQSWVSVLHASFEEIKTSPKTQALLPQVM